MAIETAAEISGVWDCDEAIVPHAKAATTAAIKLQLVTRYPKNFMAILMTQSSEQPQARRLRGVKAGTNRKTRCHEPESALQPSPIRWIVVLKCLLLSPFKSRL
jgi:hypothetical protein